MKTRRSWAVRDRHSPVGAKHLRERHLIRGHSVGKCFALTQKVTVILVSLTVWLALDFVPLLAAPPEDIPLAIVEGMLIDGNGDPPVHDAVVLIQGEKIVAAGPRGTVQIPDNAKIISAGGMTVMPGLFDFHVHLLLMGHGKYDDYFPKYRERLRREIMPASARELLLHGVTSARDMGANLEDIVEVRERITREEIPGPRLFICGPILQKTLAGVRIVIGTDSGTPINFHTESTWQEMQLMAQHGMTPLQVISAATKWPALVMGQGASLGTIEAGKLADVIVVKGNVLENLNNLQHVTHVIKGGRVYR